MARQAKGGLSKHPTKGYRLTIGKGANGSPRLFWLGHQEVVAGYFALCLREAFEGMKARGTDQWTPEVEALVRERVQVFRTTVANIHHRHEIEGRIFQQALGDAKPAAPAPGKPTSKQTFYTILDAYLKRFTAKGDREDSSKARLTATITSLKRTHSDVEAGMMTRLWLEDLIQHWKNRPPHRQTGKQISTFTVKTILSQLRSILNWAADNQDSTAFVEPRRMQSMFKYRAEEVDEIDQLTIAEIMTLYSKGSDQQRLYLLAGVTCGMTQGELAATTADEFDFANSLWTHKRAKTGIPGQHWLCPEFKSLLQARLKLTPKNDGNLAFLTREGRALVTYANGRQASDAVKQAWDDLIEKAKLTRHPSYKLCRKFCGQWMKDHGGEELGQIALQQRSQTVLSKHYAQKINFAPLHKAQKQLYRELKAAGVFAITQAEA